jgi:hypothetical protein
LTGGIIHQEDITTTYTLSYDASNFIKQILLDKKAQIDPNTIIVDNFNTPLSPIDKLYRQMNQQGNFSIK